MCVHGVGAISSPLSLSLERKQCHGGSSVRGGAKVDRNVLKILLRAMYTEAHLYLNAADKFLGTNVVATPCLQRERFHLSLSPIL